MMGKKVFTFTCNGVPSGETRRNGQTSLTHPSNL